MKSATLTTSIALVVLIAAVVCTDTRRGSCTRHEECDDSECCLAEFRLKRSFVHYTSSTCQPHGLDGDVCFAQVFEQNPHLFACPCHQNYACFNTDGFEVQNGQRGRCQPL
ncbi:uncharacterized protein [Watersipora subatra]|uniref:uncharacterized protein n=1 Tax=Watersipora subatra TaxID=2589382 RepID=UPI00355B6442